MQKIDSYPLWIRQAIWIKLRKGLEESECLNFIQDPNSNLAGYVPLLTFKGKVELEKRTGGFDKNIYHFLDYCISNFSIVEISLNTFLTIEEVCKLHQLCVEQNFVKKPDSRGIWALCEYMSGKIRLGEYFKHTGTITVDELQKAIIEFNKQVKLYGTAQFGQVLLQLNLVDKETMNAVLRLKNESKKRFVLDVTAVAPPQVTSLNTSEKQNLEEQIAKLKDENSKLKHKFMQVANLLRQNNDQ